MKLMFQTWRDYIWMELKFFEIPLIIAVFMADGKPAAWWEVIYIIALAWWLMLGGFGILICSDIGIIETVKSRPKESRAPIILGFILSNISIWITLHFTAMLRDILIK